MVRKHIEIDVPHGERAVCPNCGGTGDDPDTMICVMCGGDGWLGDDDEPDFRDVPDDGIEDTPAYYPYQTAQ